MSLQPTLAEEALAEILGALEGISHAHESPREAVLRLVEERAHAIHLCHSAQEALKAMQRRAEVTEAALVRQVGGL